MTVTAVNLCKSPERTFHFRRSDSGYKRNIPGGSQTRGESGESAGAI